MSVVFSGNNSGSFISTGKDTFIPMPSGYNRIEVYNETVLAASGAGSFAEGFWRTGMANGGGISYVKEATIGALVPDNLTIGTGFFYQDNTINVPSAPVALTAISNAATPVVSTADTTGLTAGTIVRLYNVTGGQQVSGIDFTVGTVTTNTSFTLAYMAQIAAATTGTYRIIPFVPYMYPSTRVISKIVANTDTTKTDITMTVTHNMTVGQRVRLHVPVVTSTAFGASELDKVECTITAINTTTNTITVDIPFTGTFAWPLTTDGAFTPATVVPFGENTSVALANGQDVGQGAFVNNGQSGVLLKAGAASPAGVANDVISWIAYKSFNQ